MDLSPSTSSSSRRRSSRNFGKASSIIDDLDETTEIESEVGDDEERDEFEEGDISAQIDADVDGELDAVDDIEDGAKKGGCKKSDDVFEDFEFVPIDSEVASSLSEVSFGL